MQNYELDFWSVLLARSWLVGALSNNDGDVNAFLLVQYNQISVDTQVRGAHFNHVIFVQDKKDGYLLMVS